MSSPAACRPQSAGLQQCHANSYKNVRLGARAGGWMMLAGLVAGLVILDRRATASPDSKRLYDDLLKKSGYNRLIRPVGNTTDTLIVRLGLRLTQIIDVVSLSILLPVVSLLFMYRQAPVTFFHSKDAYCG